MKAFTSPWRELPNEQNTSYCISKRRRKFDENRNSASPVLFAHLLNRLGEFLRKPFSAFLLRDEWTNEIIYSFSREKIILELVTSAHNKLCIPFTQVKHVELRASVA